MLTFNDIAVLIAEPLQRPLDVSFREQLKSRVKYWRSRLLKNSLDKKPSDRKFFTQPLTVEMEEVDAAQCSINLECKVLRSKVKIPTILRANSILFDFIGSVEGSNPFRITPRWQMYYFLKDKYASKVTNYVSYEDGYLIIPYSPLTQFVRVEGIFDDPEEVAALNCVSSTADCNFDEQDYPIPGDVAQLIVQSILDIDFRRKSEDNGPEVKVTKRPENS